MYVKQNNNILWGSLVAFLQDSVFQSEVGYFLVIFHQNVSPKI